jgi:hypothetical protein
MNHILFGCFPRIRILTFLRVAMVRNRACRVDRVVDNLADFEISFMICEELFPMFKTLKPRARRGSSDATTSG